MISHPSTVQTQIFLIYLMCTDLREVLGPHLDLLLHELLPVESFILQPPLCLFPPPPLLLQHLATSNALSFLKESVFIKYFFDLWKGFAQAHMLFFSNALPHIQTLYVHFPDGRCPQTHAVSSTTAAHSISDVEKSSHACVLNSDWSKGG